jgi:hypothetical protein
MRSRPARLTLSAIAWFALGAAAFFTVQTHRAVSDRRTALRTFETTARDAADALAGVQAGQQAYVAAGQDAAEWSAKVASHLQTATTSVDALRATARGSSTGPSLLDASTSLTQLGNIDRQARASLDGVDPQAAADLVFSEGADAVASATTNIDAAIGAEQEAADAFERAQLERVMYAAGGAVGLAALVLALLGVASPAARVASSADEADTESDTASATEFSLRTTAQSRATPAPAVHPTVPGVAPETLATAVDLCAGFARVRDAADLKALLERAAGLMNARGLIVWLGSASGADLRPVLAHGYSDQTLARIPTIARTADNAAAEAYRSGSVQIVKSRPGAAQGAIVAPMVVADGCIGALTAEMREQGEDSDTQRALATLVASQLAGVLAAAAEPGATTSAEQRAATAS